MTAPSEQLRAAAETLRRLVDGATGNRWNVHPDYLNEIVAVVQGDNLYRVLPVSDTFKQADAALIALMDPTLARLLADWLSNEADRPMYGVNITSHALALAEHINERATSE